MLQSSPLQVVLLHVFGMRARPGLALAEHSNGSFVGIAAIITLAVPDGSSDALPEWQEHACWSPVDYQETLKR
jgi:hypothetical protein